MIHYEETMDVAQPVPPSPSPGMDIGPSATLESSVLLLSHVPVDADTLRVTYAAPRDSIDQGVHLSPGEDTAKPLILVDIFPKDTNFMTKICTCLLETDEYSAINLYLNANTIIPDRVYLKWWKDPVKADARHNEVKEELESAKCYSIEFSGRLCSDTDDERYTTEKRKDLLEPEPTTEPVTSCLSVPVLSTQKPETKSPRALRSEASSVERQLSFRKAVRLRQRPCPGQAPMCQNSLVCLGAPERTSRSRGEAHYTPTDANRARDDSDLTVRRGVWNHFQYSCPTSG